MPLDLDNATVAERLEAFAALLDLAELTPYTSRAYRRAAETIRETPAPILELARSGRVEELRGIGPGIAARLRELAETGRIAELEELRAGRTTRARRPRAVLGIAPQRMLEIAAALGVESPDDFRREAREGRLRTVPGIGPATEAQILARIAFGAEPARQGTPSGPCARARSRGSRLRWAARSRATHGAGRTPRSTSASSCRRGEPGEVLDAFERLPQIVTVVEAGERRALGVTSRACRSRSISPSPNRFGTELVRRDRDVGRTSTRSSRLPEAEDEDAVYTALGVPWCPPELREEPFRGAAAATRRAHRRAR